MRIVASKKAQRNTTRSSEDTTLTLAYSQLVCQEHDFLNFENNENRVFLISKTTNYRLVRRLEHMMVRSTPKYQIGTINQDKYLHLDRPGKSNEYIQGNNTTPAPSTNAPNVVPMCPPIEFMVVIGSSNLVPCSAHFRCTENICSEAFTVMFKAGVIGFKPYKPIMDNPHNPM